jgi:hypothetical protein
LDQLLEEDDRIIEVSHLAAVAAHSSGDHRSALAHVDRALELLATEEQDAGMGDGADGDDAGEEDDEESSQRQLEEIAASKRALTLLRVECVAGAKTQPEDPEDAEEDAADDDEDEEGPSSSAAAASAGEERKSMDDEEMAD